MRRPRYCLASALGILAVLACAGRSQVAPAPAASAAPAYPEYRGHLTLGFEANRFLVCGERGVGGGWDPAGDFAGLWREIGRLEERGAFGGRERWPLYVRVRGELSPPGRYGHMGVWARQLRITEVLEARPAAPGDCDRPR